MMSNLLTVKIYARDNSTRPARYYRLNLTITQAKRIDNGAMISCGLNAPEDVTSKWLQKHGVEVPEIEWKHSGCQSSCILRGGTICQW